MRIIPTERENLPDLVLEVNDKEGFEKVLKALKKSKKFKRVWVNPDISHSWIFVKYS